MAAETSTIESPEYTQIASIDPLNLDGPLAELPKRNEVADVAWIADVTSDAVESTTRLNDIDPVVASASLRDLDFLASSMLRHGVEPMHTVDGLEDALLQMGAIADTVPRGTIATYAGANPDGERKRSFTGSPEEALFIDGLKASFGELEFATHAIARIDLGNPTERQALVASLGLASKGMDTMVQSIVNVRRQIAPEYFTGEMRPYFEPLTIDGRSYSAAGAGQLQLVAIESMLLGDKHTASEHQGFYEENYPYLTPVQRRALDDFSYRNRGQSIMGCIIQESQEGDPDLQLVSGAEDLLRKIRKFRYPHKKVADDNFNLRPPEAVGSGSYTPAILGSLITRTEAGLATLRGVKK